MGLFNSLKAEKYAVGELYKKGSGKESQLTASEALFSETFSGSLLYSSLLNFRKQKSSASAELDVSVTQAFLAAFSFSLALFASSFSVSTAPLVISVM